MSDFFCQLRLKRAFCIVRSILLQNLESAAKINFDIEIGLDCENGLGKRACQPSVANSGTSSYWPPLCSGPAFFSVLQIY
jgi:hypothetical protein